MFKTIKVLDTNYYFNTENLRLFKNSKKHLKNELKQDANYSNKKLMNTIQNFKNKKYNQKLELICTYTKYHQDNISFDDLIGFFENLGIKYSISDVITNDKRLKIIKTQKEAIEQEKKYIDLSFDRILNNSLNVGISHYLRNVIDALVIKNSSKYLCKELCDTYSNVYDYKGHIVRLK